MSLRLYLNCLLCLLLSGAEEDLPIANRILLERHGEEYLSMRAIPLHSQAKIKTWLPSKGFFVKGRLGILGRSYQEFADIDHFPIVIVYSPGKEVLMLRKIFNRRKHPRYFAQQDTFLVFQAFTQNEKKLQIHDIGEGGCAFLYHGSEYDLEKPGLVAIANHRHIYFEGVKILTVIDQPASGPFRRRGIEFKWPGGLDKKRLSTFIKKISLCKCC